MIKKSRVLGLGLSLTALALVGCSAGDMREEESTSSTADHLWSRAGTVFWTSHEVPVCFTSATWNDANLATWRNDVRLIITDGISRYTNVLFYSFTQCPASPGAGWLQIYRDDTFGNSDALSIGYNSTENKIRFGNDSHSGSSGKPNVILHEVMHKLGFDHEFNRTDSDGCSANQGVGPGSNWTPYDFASIMNSTYCQNNSALSPYDIQGLHAVYGRKHSGSIVGQGGQCLNVQGGGSAIGASLIGWPCVGGSNDTWKFQTNGLVQATIAGTQLCANVAGGVLAPSGPTPLIDWSCVAGATNETFHLTGVQWRDMGNMCVTATSAAVGGALESRACGTAPSRELWDFFEGSNRIRLNGTNLCAEVPGGATALGTELRLATCANVTQQTFAYTNGEIGFSNRCFNVLGGDPTPGRRIAVWDGCGTGLENEYFSTSGLIHGMGQCMDELGGQAQRGDAVGVYPCTPTVANQRWEYHW
jgi:hypothetical protein